MKKLVPCDIRKVWEWIRPNLEAIRERQGCEWRPEDVYAYCTTDRASLYVSEDNKTFTVLQLRQCPYTGERSVFLWVAWCDNEDGDLSDEYIPFLEELAKSEGARSLEFESKRRGFIGKSAWTPTYTKFQRRF